MALVETSQPLSIESFSYSWLIDLKPSLESLSESFRAAMDSSDEYSFIEMDPNMPPSRRFMRVEKELNFNLLVSEENSAAIVHADDIFCNGLLLPLVESLRVKSCTDSSPDVSPFSDIQSRVKSVSESKTRSPCLRRCRSLLSRKMFEKYLYFLYPLLKKIKCCRKKSRLSRIFPRNSSSFSPQASPRRSVCSAPGDYRRSCDSESSIHEAVLHCKRSFGC